MKTDYKNFFKFVSALFILAALIISCGKLGELTSDTKTDKLYFCEKYTSGTDECEGKSTKYVFFDDVNFKKPGKYKVSALKPDGTVIVSNEIEIVDK